MTENKKPMKSRSHVMKKLSKQSAYIFVLLLMVSLQLIAAPQQQRLVSGTVTDETGYALPGVTVLIKGTTQGTVTDINGKYSIGDLPANTILKFSFVGMKTAEVEVTSGVMDVVMAFETIGLNEVVAIGYGKQEKKDITGAVSSVKSEDFNKGIVSSPAQLLQGKVPGVNITSSSGAPGSGQSIIIRGQGSIRQGTGPLFVLDGFPLGLGGTGSESDPLSFNNPEDIESIDVLKDASATAIYGSRGANGVILITTKKGSSGVSRLSLSSQFGVSNMASRIPVFSADEFRKNVVAVGVSWKTGEAIPTGRRN